MPTTTTTKSSRIAQHCPLLTLAPRNPPANLLLHPATHRQRNVRNLFSPNLIPLLQTSQRPAIHGALALLHTSTLLRSESSAALRSLANLERFKVRRSLGWVDLADMVSAEVGGREWGEIVGRGDVMRDVRGSVEGIHGRVHGAEEN